jgi:hypothetical protein
MRVLFVVLPERGHSSQLFHQPRIFEPLLAAVAGEPCTLVLSAGECRQVLRSLLGAGPHRQAAARIGDSYRRENGAVRAAELILGLHARAERAS